MEGFRAHPDSGTDRTRAVLLERGRDWHTNIHILITKGEGTVYGGGRRGEMGER